MPESPRRGDVWLVDLGDPVGHEAGFHRPGLIVSDDEVNRFGLAVLCPVGTARRGYPTRVEIDAGGLDDVSYVQVEQIRTVSTSRLLHRMAVADTLVMTSVDRVLRILLRL